MTRVTRLRVAPLTDGSPATTRETVDRATPASRATSRIRGRLSFSAIRIHLAATTLDAGWKAESPTGSRRQAERRRSCGAFLARAQHRLAWRSEASVTPAQP